MSVLDEIVEKRRRSLPNPREVARLEATATQKEVPALLRRPSGARPRLISEIKRKSPSKGSINPEMTVERAVKLYQPYASAISVLTEPNYFGGSLEDLREAAALTEIPLLRKDFIVDPVQIREARHYGADFFLLMLSVLDQNQMEELLEAGREYNMEALVEVHDEAELERALQLDISILGINNRNLHDLSIDLATTPRLLARIPEQIMEGLTIVGESGLSSRADLDQLPQRVDAVLIGTAFMNSPNPEQLLEEMFS